MNPLLSSGLLLAAAALPLQAQIYADFTVSQGDEPLGTFRAELAWDKAPRPVAHFIGLATGRHPWIDNDTGLVHYDTPYYDGSHFHRLIHNFVIQGGDPPDKEGKRPGYVVQDQFHEELRHNGRFILSWAKSNLPNTTGGQFFITLGRSGDPVEAANLAGLDDKHSVFGEVTEGRDIVRDFTDPGKFPTNAADRPLTQITLDSVVISGPSLEGFDINDPALRLPVVGRKQFTPTRGPEADEFTMTWDRAVQTDYVLSLGAGLDDFARFRNLLSIDAPDQFEFTVSGVVPESFPSFFGYLAAVDYSLLPNAPTELTAAGNSLTITDRGGVSVTLVFDGAEGGTWSDTRGRSGTLSAVNWTDRVPETGTLTRNPSFPFFQRTAAIELPLGVLQATFSRPAGRDNWLELGVNVSFHEENSGFIEGGANNRDGVGVAVNQAFQLVPAGG